MPGLNLLLDPLALHKGELASSGTDAQHHKKCLK